MIHILFTIVKLLIGERAMTDEITYRLLKAIEKNPKTNRRQLADEMDVSLGRLNFFINELLEKGYITTEESTTKGGRRRPIF